jgi:hypothetical protein
MYERTTPQLLSFYPLLFIYIIVMYMLWCNIHNRKPISVSVLPNSSVEEVIKKALAAHRDEQLLPALAYHAPECYELRLHEGKYPANTYFYFMLNC